MTDAQDAQAAIDAKKAEQLQVIVDGTKGQPWVWLDQMNEAGTLIDHELHDAIRKLWWDRHGAEYQSIEEARQGIRKRDLDAPLPKHLEGAPRKVRMSMSDAGIECPICGDELEDQLTTIINGPYPKVRSSCMKLGCNFVHARIW